MKIALIFLGLILTLLMTGCWVYGTGESIGYIYAVDDGIAWDKVWYKSSLDSSESDCYLLSTEDANLKQELRAISGGQKVKISYNRHIYTWAMCPEGTGTEDEIISVEIVGDING